MTKSTSSSSGDVLPWPSSFYYVAPLIVGWRIWWANRMPLMDCDEVYNYWEPLHFLLFGSGFQTWEYSHAFALRTYAYLMPLYGLSKFYLVVIIPLVPGWFWTPLLTDQFPVMIDDDARDSETTTAVDPKLALFLLLRASLAGSMAVAEILFCQALQSYSTTRSNNGATTKEGAAPSTQILIGKVTAMLLWSAAGMSHSAGALLPSSTLMFLWMLAATAYMHEYHVGVMVCAITATLGIGWPFGVVLFVPLGLGVLVRAYKRHTLWRCWGQIIGITIAIQSAVMIVDRHYYGKWVAPVWNILVYNTQAGGDELYGVEPLSYYTKNLALNFNLVAVGVLVLPVLLCLMYLQKSADKQRQHQWGVLLVVLAPMYLWLAMVIPRPHKEERFLFAIYPSICLGAAVISVSLVESLYSLLLFVRKQSTTKKMPVKNALFIQILLLIPCCLLSLSRTMALAKYYSSPLHVYANLQNQEGVADATVCTCGEWYRFPSSFYLPSTKPLQFLPSSFEGQLPQEFSSHGSHESSPLHFNDRNLPEAGSLLVENQSDCDYIVDLWNSNNCRENDSEWMPLAMGAFLDADRTSTLHRVLYIPRLHEEASAQGDVQYDDYVLYKRM